MSDLICFSLGILTPFVVYVLSFYVVNRWMLWLKYEWLNMPPFNCHKCLNFWSNIAVCVFGLIATYSAYFAVTDIIVTLLLTLSFYFKYK